MILFVKKKKKNYSSDKEFSLSRELRWVRGGGLGSWG